MLDLGDSKHTLHSSKPNASHTDTELIGELFAAHAAVAMIGSFQQAE
jgi:hypothetical protein